MSTVRYQRYLHNTGLDRQPIILPIRCHIRNNVHARPRNPLSSEHHAIWVGYNNSDKDP
jgi:hypothetical protein